MPATPHANADVTQVETWQNPGVKAAALVDPMGRRIHKLRVQLIDACNFRCTYCMPESARFLSARALLAPGELRYICGSLLHLGIDEIRITGGEPTLRRDFEAAVEAVADFPWTRLGLTSNGAALRDKLPFLWSAGCRALNISLDSLREGRFHAITRRSHFRATWEALHAAVAAGFRVKINVVVMRGVNDDEIPDFLDFSQRLGVEVRFLELMRIGPGRENHGSLFVSGAEILDRIRAHREAKPVDAPEDSTARLFALSGGAHVGLIASESQPFCGSCSRLRLTATGKLRACLFSEAGVELRGLDRLDYPEALNRVLRLKPTGRLPQIAQAMNEIGG